MLFSTFSAKKKKQNLCGQILFAVQDFGLRIEMKGRVRDTNFKRQLILHLKV